MGPPPVIKLDQVLEGVTRLGFDTAPFIYFVERYSSYVDLLREIIRRVDVGTIAGYSSVVTLTEVLTLPKSMGNVALETKYRDLLLYGRHFMLVPITSIIAERAAALRA
jgi:predicted nucleic acid-binding protein